MVFGAAFGGYLALATPLYDLFTVRARVIFGTFVLSVLVGTTAATGHMLLLRDGGGHIFIAGTVPICAAAISLLFFICSVTFFVRPGVLTRSRFSSLGVLTTSGTVAVLVYLVLFTLLAPKSLFPSS
jgi:hypothetical protein